MTPDDHTNQELMLEVIDGHTLYVQDWGNKQAETPIMMLHGGPGAGTGDSAKRYFNPATQRVIFHDQRGSGKSLPAGSIEHNTTQDLIEDIQKIADKLQLNSLIITGRSWGSCLALAYAQQHPERVKALVLGGIFTGSQQEIDWLGKGMFRAFYPEVWEYFVSNTPAEHQNDPTAYHMARVLGTNEEDAISSGHLCQSVQGAVMSLDDRFVPMPLENFDLSSVRIEMHYMSHGCFMPDRQLINGAGKLTMPVWLIQGRYDMVCPPQAAHDLHKALPNSQLITTTEGHRSERETWNVMRTILLQLTHSKEGK